MSSTKRPAGSLQSGAALSAAGTLVLGALLAAGMSVAHGQDAVPGAKPASSPVAVSDSTSTANGASKGAQAAAAPGAAAGGSSASGAQGAPSGTQTGTGAQGAAPGAQSASGTNQAGEAQQASGSAGKPQPVCFPLTGRCVEGAKASAAKGGTHNASKDGSSAQRPLNLTAPDVRTVVSADELKEPLPSSDQIAEVQEADTVSVKSEGVPTDVPGGFGAIWWALNHPSQAWKIVVPY